MAAPAAPAPAACGPSASVQLLETLLRQRTEQNRELQQRLRTPVDPLEHLRAEQRDLERRLLEVEKSRTDLQHELRVRQKGKRKLAAKEQKTAAEQPPPQPLAVVDGNRSADDDAAFYAKLDGMAAERKVAVDRFHQQLDECVAQAAVPPPPPQPAEARKVENPYQAFLRRRERALVPAPFSMEQRQAVRKACPTDVQRRKHAELEQRREAEDAMLAAARRGPVANPVPPSTFMNRFEVMQGEWVARKEELKEKAREVADSRRGPVPGYIGPRPRHYVPRAATTDDLPDGLGVSDGYGGLLHAPSRTEQSEAWVPRGSAAARSQSVRQQQPQRRSAYEPVTDRLKKRGAFKARDVPPAVKELRWQQICENEIARKLRVKEQARYRYAELGAQMPSRLMQTTESRRGRSARPQTPTAPVRGGAERPSSAEPTSRAVSPPRRQTAIPTPRDAAPASRRSASVGQQPPSASRRSASVGQQSRLSTPRDRNQNLTFRPAVNSGVPNFPMRWEQDRNKRQELVTQQRACTEPQEFRLSKGSGLKSAAAVTAEIEFDERTLPERRWPQLDGRRRPRRRSPPYTTYELDARAPAYTKAEHLRLVKNMKRIVERDAEERREQQEAARRGTRQKEIDQRVARLSLQHERERKVLLGDDQEEERKKTGSARMPGRPGSPEKRARRLERFAEKMRTKADRMLAGQPPIWLRTPGPLADDEADARAVAAGGRDDASSDRSSESGGEGEAASLNATKMSKQADTSVGASEKGAKDGSSSSYSD
eukprot:TRINITY_DN1753_c2_g1_i1.p1 TRINITY_DN1753_c2_g1~~TRINITY_DN1753_c2_g1_i1.p1  ORF type:complete len:770 (+),score=176.29 TRINITY_DN1753_c2_g1_i1:82-2391(+)